MSATKKRDVRESRRVLGVRLYPTPKETPDDWTYPDGYSGAWRPLSLIRLRSDVRMLDPEVRRRVFRMMKDGHRNGKAVGIGGAGRTSDGQRALFLARHYEVSSGGCCSLDGRRYQLRSGMAHAAPPFLSYHEPTTPKGKALAVDGVGDLVWVGQVCGYYGLVTFANVGSEPWHWQPPSIPTSRRYYSPAVHHPLPRWIKRRKLQDVGR